MAPLLSKKNVLQIGLETTHGTGVSPTTDCLAFDVELSSETEFIARKGTSGYLGQSSPGVLGELLGACNFRTELRGDGIAGLDDAVEILLQACGFSVATNIFTPVSAVSGQKSITLEQNIDGVKKRLTGAMGTVKLTYERGKPAYLEFEFKGLWITPTDAAMPTFTPGTAIPAKCGSGILTIGGSTRGISKLELDMANQLAWRDNHYVITDREPVVSADMEADTVASYDLHGLWVAGTDAAVSLTLAGTQTITIAVPKLQYKEVKPGDRDGLAIYDITGQCNVNAGNDEVTITVS